MTAAAGELPDTLPHRVGGSRSPLLWGVGLLIAIEGTVMSLFVTSYFYLRLGYAEWPPPELGPPDLFLPTIATALIVASPLPVWVALRLLERGRRAPLLAAVPAGIALVAGYLALMTMDALDKGYDWRYDAYASVDWSMSAYAALHAVAVILAGATVLALALRGRFGPARHAGVQGLLMYWLFVAAGSLLFYATQYLSPYVT